MTTTGQSFPSGLFSEGYYNFSCLLLNPYDSGRKVGETFLLVNYTDTSDFITVYFATIDSDSSSNTFYTGGLGNSDNRYVIYATVINHSTDISGETYEYEFVWNSLSDNVNFDSYGVSALHTSFSLIHSVYTRIPSDSECLVSFV